MASSSLTEFLARMDQVQSSIRPQVHVPTPVDRGDNPFLGPMSPSIAPV